MEPKLYLELLKKCLLNEIYIENEARFLYIFASLITGNPIDSNVVREIGNRLPELVKRIKDARLEGKPWWFVDVKRGGGTFERINLRNLCEFSHTMIGRMRLNNIEQCLDVIRKENIPGDLVETGVWRGGACIFMKGYLKAYEMRGRRVFVCDSFEGLPKPTAPEDERYDFSKEKMPILAITEQEVRENFLRYDLLDEDVIFVKGWFKDTLNKLPTNQIALLRLDGDLYESTEYCLAAIEYLDQYMEPGDILVVEDGIILDLGLEEQYNGGPNRAVIEFIRKRAGKYRLLIEYCDFWGENLTWNPNGYWIKVGE